MQAHDIDAQPPWASLNIVWRTEPLAMVTTGKEASLSPCASACRESHSSEVSRNRAIVGFHHRLSPLTFTMASQAFRTTAELAFDFQCMLNQICLAT
jgi:hypothetical protein